MVCVCRRQSGKPGEPCQGTWALVEPRDQAVDIDRGSDRDVLQVGLCQAPIPTPSQAKGTDPLGELPFDAGPSFIADFRSAKSTHIPPDKPQCFSRTIDIFCEAIFCPIGLLVTPLLRGSSPLHSL